MNRFWSLWAAFVALATSTQAYAQSACPSVLKHDATPLIGDKAESLCQYAGKAVLVVNTASNCGFTPQYDGLEKLYGQYKSKGLVIIGFPTNDFGGQEAGNNTEIAKFCKLNYGVSFPMYQKLSKPIGSEPLFSGLAKASGSVPSWNFHKYLIDQNGKVVGYGSDVEPQSATLKKAIDKALLP
jgi:glutathione peroxidase